MEIVIKSTDKITEIAGVLVRYWEGVTEKGVRCHVFVHRLAVHNDDDSSEFDQELREMGQPKRMVSLSRLLD